MISAVCDSEVVEISSSEGLESVIVAAASYVYKQLRDETFKHLWDLAEGSSDTYGHTTLDI